MPTFAMVIHLCKTLNVNVYVYTLCDVNLKEKRRWLNTKAHIFTLFSSFLVSLTSFKLIFLWVSLQFCQFFQAPGRDTPVLCFCLVPQAEIQLSHTSPTHNCLVLFASQCFENPPPCLSDRVILLIILSDEPGEGMKGREQSVGTAALWVLSQDGWNKKLHRT